MTARILVTGASGFAGRAVVPALLARGFTVRGQFSRAPGANPDVDWQQMDFLASADYARLVAGCDAVVHLAAELSDRGRMDTINVAATRALLEAARGAGVRYFGYASSIVVYGSPRNRAVDEATPLLDLQRPIASQYHAEPYMLDYARTKTLAELAIRNFHPACVVDLYRPAVVADDARLSESLAWSASRKFGAAYRCTQYIAAEDAAAAIAHLVARGLSDARAPRSIEAYNISDAACGTYRALLRAADQVRGTSMHAPKCDLPVLLDLAKDLVKYKPRTLRYPLGLLAISNAKLLATGFEFPLGIQAAQARALAAG